MRRHRPQHALPVDWPRRVALGACALVVAVLSVLQTVRAANLGPEHRFPGMNDALAATIPVALDQLDAQTRYLVTFDDHHGAGLAALTLVNEMDRAGLQGFLPAGEPWDSLVGRHRTAADTQATVAWVTGPAIERWREDGWRELAHHTPSPDDAAELLRLRSVLRFGLLAQPDLQWMVDGNLFGLSTHPDLPVDLLDEVNAAMALSVPSSILVKP